MPTLVSIARLLWDDCRCVACCEKLAGNISHYVNFYSGECTNVAVVLASVSRACADSLHMKAFIAIGTEVSGLRTHYVNIYITPQGFVSKMIFRPWKSTEDTSLDTFDPDATQLPWEALDEQITKFSTSMDELLIYLRDNEKRSVEAYIRSHMPYTQSAGKLRFHSPWDAIKRANLKPGTQ